MEVTLSNFEQVLPCVCEAIDASDFLSIDAEFTGLRNGFEVTAYDTPAEYYGKLREGSVQFLLIQVGICTFKLNKEKNKYTYRAFNFYLFPQSTHRSDTNFICQVSSIRFLSSAGFDFNKLFKEGIPYLTSIDEKMLTDELITKYENLNNTESPTKVTIPENLIPFIEDTCKRIEQFLLPDNEKTEIILDNCNGFMRKLVFQTVYERFRADNFSITTKWIDHNAVLVVRKGKSKTELDHENYEKDKNEIQNALGFSKVIRHISRSRKLIIGHNMLLDICHIVNRFCWPLPKSYTEFKQMVNQLFPRLVDTKYMCSTYPLKELIASSVLHHVLKRIREPPFRFLHAEAESPEFCYNAEECKAHEAGYDAYITGLLFISLTGYLGSKFKQNSPQNGSVHDIIKPFENRLRLMKIADYSYVNLKGDEPKPIRNHIFHITFPKEWKTSDIIELFVPYCNVHVSYCDQRTAWVTLLDQTKSESVISNLVQSKGVATICKPYTLITWKEYAHCRRKQTGTNNPNAAAVTSSRNDRRFSDQLNSNDCYTATIAEHGNLFTSASATASSMKYDSADTTTAAKMAGPQKLDEHHKTKRRSKRRENIYDSPNKRRKNVPSEISNSVMGENENTSTAAAAIPQTSAADDLRIENASCDKINDRKKFDLISGVWSTANDRTLLFGPVTSNEDHLRKTFEEPSWE